MWQSVLIIYPYPNNPLVFECHTGYPVNKWLFAWNPISAVVLGIMIISAIIRLRAFAELGENFTFTLQKPDRLRTDGLYAYVQHPSYTTVFVIAQSSAAWFFRLDGVLAMALPVALLRWQSYVHTGCFLVSAICWSLGLRLRAVEEEAMLKRTFGKEWIDWAAKTARFVPGIY